MKINLDKNGISPHVWVCANESNYRHLFSCGPSHIIPYIYIIWINDVRRVYHFWILSLKLREGGIDAMPQNCHVIWSLPGSNSSHCRSRSNNKKQDLFFFSFLTYSNHIRTIYIWNLKFDATVWPCQEYVMYAMYECFVSRYFCIYS